MTTTELAERVEKAVLDAQGAQVVAFRALANESDIMRCKVALRDATDELAARMEAKREADTEAADRKREHDESLAEWEFTLGGYFRSAGNKTFLTVDDDGNVIAEDEQRSMTADDRRDWVARIAAKRTAPTAQALRQAELANQQAADSVRIAEKRWSAANTQLNAAASWLGALSNALKGANGEH